MDVMIQTYRSELSKSFEKPKEETKKEANDVLSSKTKFVELMSVYLEPDIPTIQRQISDHMEYTLARDRTSFDAFSTYQATAYSVRDRLIQYWNDTNFRFTDVNAKQVYYLSIEYLLGRTLRNSLLNLEIEPQFQTSLKELGENLEDLYDQEVDAGLGNGGLGRLAACYLDSLATQNYVAWGYGIRYTYGMFRQEIFQGYQAEIPDLWLKRGNPWEITRFDVKYPVRFYGEAGFNSWDGGEVVVAVANDTPIPGYKTTNTINLRLWSSEPSMEFDLSSFNEGNYYKAIERRQRAEAISSVLYPTDHTQEGKELRLKQQYFFTSATLQDVISRFKRRKNTDFNHFPDKVAIQLNDTHPTIAIVELMRLLIDVEGLDWKKAVDVTRRTFAYTNHTVLPEALEKWSVSLMNHLLPRHMQIIYQINHMFIEEELKKAFNNNDIIGKLSIIEEGHDKKVRMAHLAIVMSHHVNGVAALHSQILIDSLFKEFNQMYPGKFLNVTNGITPRRWLLSCNPQLCNLIEKKLGAVDFITHLDKLHSLAQFADNAEFQNAWMAVKLENKKRFAKYLWENCKIQVDPKALFDIQIKRIHEYKRQLLNILRVIWLYNDLKIKAELGNTEDVVPKVIVFAGKAAPGYFRAKNIIKLINNVAEKVNNDKSIGGCLKVIFVPNYNVSLAELIIPASDLSQHISTAGLEASGTSNMKFALNGGLIIGTLDGANIEIRDCIGHDNMFIFGLETPQVPVTRASNATKHTIHDPRLQKAVDSIRSGTFGDPNLFHEICDSLLPSRDYYLLGDDFSSYVEAHNRVDKAFKNHNQWAKMSILSTAGMGNFTSDRSIKDYAEKIWNVAPNIPNDPRSPKISVEAPKK